jgi:hypothetical protein
MFVAPSMGLCSVCIKRFGAGFIPGYADRISSAIVSSGALKISKRTLPRSCEVVW